MFRATEPDKYEKWVGIDNVERAWKWDNRHQCWHQSRNYDLEDLAKIYHIGYRSEKFRGEQIEDAFKRIRKLTYSQSENKYRVRWFLDHFKGLTLLDIGTGIGVFPYELRTHGWMVEATEENLISINWLTNGLNIKCYSPEDPIKKEHYDVISLVHVLEHMDKFDSLFEYILEGLKPDGSVYIEVPDAVEFDYLPGDSDEFNSCHVWFFDVSGLYRLVSRYLRVTDIHRAFHRDRNLSRIMLRATKKS